MRCASAGTLRSGAHAGDLGGRNRWLKEGTLTLITQEDKQPIVRAGFLTMTGARWSGNRATAEFDKPGGGGQGRIASHCRDGPHGGEPHDAAGGNEDHEPGVPCGGGWRHAAMERRCVHGRPTFYVVGELKRLAEPLASCQT